MKDICASTRIFQVDKRGFISLINDMKDRVPVICKLNEGISRLVHFFFIGNARGEKFADHGRCEDIKIDRVMKH